MLGFGFKCCSSRKEMGLSQVR
ncbi:hypothetical protein MASSI9I_70162 [Massilia sp. 9I]|nr:hypothetical protein MASSI9I_70162 [Massilia sp. 9I]